MNGHSDALPRGRVGSTNMKIAKGFDNQESLPLPANQMLAIVADKDMATHVTEVLNQNGFTPDDIGILVGPQDARKLDAATGAKGIFAKILTTGIDMATETLTISKSIAGL
jgi:hypothetical protein